MIVDVNRYLQAGLKGGRNLAIGINLVSLGLTFRPARFVEVVSTLLSYFFKTLTGQGGLEQRNPQGFYTSSRDMKYQRKLLMTVYDVFGVTKKSMTIQEGSSSYDCWNRSTMV